MLKGEITMLRESNVKNCSNCRYFVVTAGTNSGFCTYWNKTNIESRHNTPVERTMTCNLFSNK